MLSPSSIIDDSFLSYMYITPGLDSPNFNIKTSNSCRQTENDKVTVGNYHEYLSQFL